MNTNKEKMVEYMYWNGIKTDKREKRKGFG